MFTLYVQELNKPPVLAFLYSEKLTNSFKQLDYFEKHIITPNFMFWVVDSNNPNTVLVSPCAN